MLVLQLLVEDLARLLIPNDSKYTWQTDASLRIKGGTVQGRDLPQERRPF